MTKDRVEEIISRFERWHKDVQIQYTYDSDNKVYFFIMHYTNKYIECCVSEFMLNCNLTNDPLSYYFYEMAHKLGVTITNRWEYR